MSGNLHCRMALYYFLGPHIQSLGWNIPHSVWQAGRYRVFGTGPEVAHQRGDVLDIRLTL